MPKPVLRRSLALLLVPALLASSLATPGVLAAPSLAGVVVAVIGGDTIQVRVGDRRETVHYIGITAPTLRRDAKEEEPGAREATEFNRRLVEGQTVRLELDAQERDRSGHLLAYVFVGDVMANAELVAQGHARVLAVPPNVRQQARFERLEHEARLLQLGLWKGVVPRRAGQGKAGARLDLATLTCPATHPVKGSFATRTGERCIYHVPGGELYGGTKAQRCYATEGEAQQDGCSRSKR